MNPEEIKKRQRFVEGEPLKDRLEEAKFNRRDSNFVESPKVENIEFDTFFDYENELSGITASNQQVDNSIALEQQSGPVVMRAVDDMPTATHGGIDRKLDAPVATPIIMRPVYKKDSEVQVSNAEAQTSGAKKKAYDDVVGFEFVRCEHTMKNGSRCRRQAPKNDTICSIHKKMLKNIKIN